MLKATIKTGNKVWPESFFETQEELDKWLSVKKSTNYWGFGQRKIVKDSEQYNPEEVLSEEPEIIDVELDENGQEVTRLLQPALVTLKAEYDITITDITADWQKEKLEKEARAYLNSTDWYVIKAAETGTEVPAEIKLLRQQARDNIN